MKSFYLQRNIDETGISGTGKVACGFEFWENGPAFMYWNTNPSSFTFYKSMKDVVTIHGHNGKTELVWIDKEENVESVISTMSDFVRKWFG